MQIPDYYNALKFINSFTKSGAKVVDLSRFSALMNALGNPQNSFKTIHVAGTNGKGSVCQFIAAGLENAGYKTGKFTSPYIIKPEERIQINSQFITENALAYFVGIVKNAVENLPADYSQFEIFSAVMFLYFSGEEVDYAVIETGIGGSLDCTNIITPQLSVITNIDFDHTAILGDSIEKIAAHKAGIIKVNVPVVTTSTQNPAALEVIREVAAEKHAPLIIPQPPTLERADIYGNIFYYDANCYKTTMCGEHQIYNAITAAEALKVLGVSEKNIALALLTSLPARLQVVRSSPLLIVDGAHNDAAISAAMKTLSVLPKLTMILGFLDNKNYKTAFRRLLPLSQKIIAVDFFAVNAVRKEYFVDEAEKSGIAAGTADNAAHALQIAGTDDTLIIGSLYLASQMLHEIEQHSGKKAS